jgi:hypothetical protein
MKRFLAAMVAALMMVVLVSSAAVAAVNAVTPSTNDINRTNGWAHVDADLTVAGEATLTFVSTRAFVSCFEYRTDGDTSQVLAANGGVNYNPLVLDGLYPFRCVNNSSDTVTVPANGYVEVRMVFGAETDERFDWTSFDVLPVPKCTATGFIRDGINLTAAQIGGTVTGTLDATTCNIGAYNPTGVTGATIFGANYFGVVVDGVSADVTDSAIHAIGEVPLNGAQHGNALVYVNGASGIVSGNTISDYQKNGITASGVSTSVSILNNIVTGEGPVTYIAQNGIQISYGATAALKGNTVSGNDYTPKAWVACGVLFYQAAGVKASNNNLFNNEANLCNVGRGGGHFNP